MSASPPSHLHIIMDGDLESNTKAPPMQTPAPRARLLLSCGESILAVAESAYRRVEAPGCPVGRLARGVSHAAAPVLRPLRLRCLSALSFADRHRAAAQGAAAALFPRAERVLGKVDDLVVLVESLPVRFDGAVDGAAGIAPVKRPRDGEGGGVFRDIRCDREAVGVEKITGEAQCDGDIIARSAVGDDHPRHSSDEIAGHGDDAAQGVCSEAMQTDAEKQEASSDESKGEGDPMSSDTSGDEQRAEGVKVNEDGRAVEVAETHAAEIVEAARSTEAERVETQQVAPAEAAVGSV